MLTVFHRLGSSLLLQLGRDSSTLSKSAATKRERTRSALLSAAHELFSVRGWQDTRMEDVANARRRATLLQLAAEVPAAILADLLHLSPGTATRWTRDASGDWSRYAASLALFRGHRG